MQEPNPTAWAGEGPTSGKIPQSQEFFYFPFLLQAPHIGAFENPSAQQLFQSP